MTHSVSLCSLCRPRAHSSFARPEGTQERWQVDTMPCSQSCCAEDAPLGEGSLGEGLGQRNVLFPSGEGPRW